MVTFEEFANLVNLIKHNQQMPAEDIVHEYQDWSSSEGETFTKVDENRQMFEVNREFQLHYLGQGLRGFGAFQPLGKNYLMTLNSNAIRNRGNQSCGFGIPTL